MQLAIRRAFPARQRLGRPHRFRSAPPPRLPALSRCLSHSSRRPSPDDPLPPSKGPDIPPPIGRSEPSPDEVESAPPEERIEGSAAPPDDAGLPFPDGVVDEIVGSSANGPSGGGRGRGRPLGSRGKRTALAKSKEPSPPRLPEWFMERRVGLHEERVGQKLMPLAICSSPRYAARKEGEMEVPDVTEQETDEGVEAEQYVANNVDATMEYKSEGASTQVSVEFPTYQFAESQATKEKEKEDADEAALESTETAEQQEDKTEVNDKVEKVAEVPAEEEVDAQATKPDNPSENGGLEQTKPGENADQERMSFLDEWKEMRVRYYLHEDVWKEVKTTVQAGLRLPKGQFAENMASMKSHCILHLPKKGGTYFLDTVAYLLAASVEADLIRLDPQDLAELGGDYLGDSKQFPMAELSSLGIRSLGYDTQQAVRPSTENTAEENATSSNQTEYEEDEEDEQSDQPVFSGSFPSVLPRGSAYNFLQTMLQSGRAQTAVIPLGNYQQQVQEPSPKEKAAKAAEHKMSLLLEALLSAPALKRATKPAPPTEAENAPPRRVKTIVHIRDYQELERTVAGSAILKMLHEIVQSRRQNGERIMILGTGSHDESISDLNPISLQSIQSQNEDSLERTIIIPPMHGNKVFDTEESTLAVDNIARIREVNMRHLQDVIRRRSGEDGEEALLNLPEDWHLDPIGPEVPGIDLSFWSFDRVHRVATVALGERASATEITVEDIKNAISIIERSDEVKVSWAAKEKVVREAIIEAQKDPKAPKVPKGPLNSHEKKLLAGVIDPRDIHTGFSHVHAPSETVESLKALTSLALVRPDAFKYGVLATDRIPGVLLYGPPGTGKTLLAKAVAKESGATVLEVAGSEIMDMYVGNSEKNVKAVFSLAKKLAPCVIFIDEADAIFGSRQSLSTRSAHREIINQFLKEWGDMASNAFIMVATNRPFDLDDAVLRRLPRRILVDLPTKSDREAILRIHLQGEVVSPSVKLPSLAEKTPLYSGSDLKNLCVSAALACVKEENEKYKESGKYPEKRVLEDRHFKHGLDVIAASISDDMGSLTAIRKFDEKYGEQAGRKKRKSLWGFDAGQLEQKGGSGVGRVRPDV